MADYTQLGYNILLSKDSNLSAYEQDTLSEFALGINSNNQDALVGSVSIGYDKVGESGKPLTIVAGAVNTAGQVIADYINDKLNTEAGEITGEFDFTGSGALQIGTYVNGTSGDIKISPAGIVGRNSDGDNTFTINGTSGAATFAGELTAPTGTIGGWTIGSTSLISGTDATTVGLDSGGTNPAIYAGSATPGSAPFRVTNAGALTASDVTITGGSFSNIDLQSLAAGSLLSIQGWQFSSTFSATDYRVVAWTLGTITLMDGTTFSITAGNTGNMAAVTYIYFDKAISETELQTSTTASDAVGANKILIAVAKDNADVTKNATFQVFGGTGGVETFITADNIAADTITANEIAANTITASEIAASTITGTEIVASVSLTSPTITGGSIAIGSGDSIFKADSNGIYLGNATFASAPFRVNMSGAVTMNSATITGGTVAWSTVAGTTDAPANNATVGAIFGTNISGGSTSTNRVNNSGYMTTITGDSITTGTLNADRIGASSITSDKISVSSLSALAVNAGNIRVGGSSNTYGSISVKDSSGTEVALLNNNAIIVRENKAFASESSSSGVFTQFYTSGLNGIIEITNNTSGTFGIKDDDSSDYLMKWTNYECQSWKSIYPGTNGGADLGSSSYKWDDVFCAAMKGLYGEIYLDQAGRIQVTNHFDPSGTGSYNLGGSTRYWADVSYKTLTDRGCLGWFDDGVEMQDGTKVSDMEAIQSIKKHPTKKTIYGVPMLDYKTFPKVSYKKALDHEGNEYKRDKNDEPEEIEEDEIFSEYNKKTNKKEKRIVKKKVLPADGIEMTSMFSIMLGALKELDNRLKIAEEEIRLLKNYKKV